MEETKKIPLREEIPMKDRWATEDLYPTDEAWEAELATLREEQKLLCGFCGRLGESAGVLCEYLRNMERVDAKVNQLANYCMRKADEDTRNPVYQAMQGKFMGAAVELQAAVSFETPQIMEISGEKLEAFYAACPELTR